MLNKLLIYFCACIYYFFFFSHYVHRFKLLAFLQHCLPLSSWINSRLNRFLTRISPETLLEFDCKPRPAQFDCLQSGPHPSAIAVSYNKLHEPGTWIKLNSTSAKDTQVTNHNAALQSTTDDLWNGNVAQNLHIPLIVRLLTIRNRQWAGSMPCSKCAAKKDCYKNNATPTQPVTLIVMHLTRSIG